MIVDQQQIVALIRKHHLFQKMDEPQLKWVADQFRDGQYQKGQEIYSQGSLAQPDSLYLIQEGRVVLRMTRGGTQGDLVILKQGDFFGYEMLADGRYRLSTAVADTDVKLLKLDRAHLSALLQKFPYHVPAYKMLYESYMLRHQVPLKWCDKDEVVYFMSRRHPFNLAARLGWVTLFAVISSLIISLFLSNNPTLSLIPFVILLLDWVVIALWAGWNILDWLNDYSIITNRRVLFQENVIFLYESRQESPLNAVLSTATQTSFFGRMFKYGNLVVRTYAGSVFLPMISNPERVRMLLDVLCAATKQAQAQVERKSMEELIRQKIGYTVRPAAAGPSAPVPASMEPRSGGMNTFLKMLEKWFKLRYEKGGAVIFHTHWIILLYKILLPTLSLLGVLALFVLVLIGHLQSLSFTVAMGVVAGAGLAGLCWWAYEFVDWRNDVYIITEDQVVDVNKRPLGQEIRDAAQLKNILSVEFERAGIIALLLNFGTVSIMVGEKRLTFDNVYNPSEVQYEIFKRMAERDLKDKQAAGESERQRMTDWLSAYHRVVEDERNARNQAQS